MYRYRGFISYSRHDAREAIRLHRALETYRVPKTIEAPVDERRKLGRFFRDDDEMSAASSLGAALRGILDDAEVLIVLCSPRAAQSAWVNREIIHFKQSGRGNRILAVIVDGEPMSDDPAKECFPPACRYRVAPDGTLTDDLDEVLGVDIRKEGYAKSLMRIIAALLEIKFDELWQRERRRRMINRLRMSVVGAILLAVVGTGGFYLVRENALEVQRTMTETARRQAALGRFDQAYLLTLAALPRVPSWWRPAAPEALLELKRAIPRNQLAMVLEGHKGIVWSVAYSPDGEFILTGGGDRVAKLWDLATGEEVRSFAGHNGEITSVTFSPDGKTIATANQDQWIRLFDRETGERIGIVVGHANVASAVGFAPDGKSAVSASWDGTARIWKVPSGDLIRVLSGHRGPVTHARFSPDGSRILTTSADRTARIWDVQTGQQLTRFRLHQQAVSRGVFLPDGKSVLTVGADRIGRLWDARTGVQTQVLRFHNLPLTTVAVSPDGAYAFTASMDAGVDGALWDLRAGKMLHAFRYHDLPVWDAAFSPDGRTLLTGSVDEKAHLYRLDHILEKRRLDPGAGRVTAAALSPDGRTVAIARDTTTAEVWDWRTGAQVLSLSGHEGPLASIAVSPDGQSILTGSKDQTAKLWNAGTGRLIRTLTGHRGAVEAVAFSPDGAAIATGSADGSVLFWEPRPDGLSVGFKSMRGPINAVAFSPDGKRVLTGGVDGVARLWDVRTGVEIRSFLGHGAQIYDVAFSPNGRLILTGSGDDTARIWDVYTGREVLKLEDPFGVPEPAAGNVGDVRAVAFAPDGRTILTTGINLETQLSYARLWEVATGKEIRTYDGIDGAVTVLGYAPDGKTVMVGGADGTVRFWDAALLTLSARDLVERACTHWPRGMLPMGRDALSPEEAREFLGDENHSRRVPC